MLDEKKIDGLVELGNYRRKKQIVLTNTNRNIGDFISSLKYRYNGENKILPHYIISRDGDLFSVIPPHTYSSFLDSNIKNKQSIIICLENLGWLRKNPLSNDYLNWIGNKYRGEIYDRKWRGYNFWQPYTEIQLEKTKELILYLCETFDIPYEFIGHNVKVDNVQKFRGITSLSNYDNKITSLNPAFDFDIFINK